MSLLQCSVEKHHPENFQFKAQELDYYSFPNVKLQRNRE